MRRVGAVLTASLIGLVVLSGCSTTNTTGVKNCGDWPGASCEQTVTYKGRPLDCIVWSGGHGEKGMTCDFVAYHESDGFGGN